MQSGAAGSNSNSSNSNNSAGQLAVSQQQASSNLLPTLRKNSKSESSNDDDPGGEGSSRQSRCRVKEVNFLPFFKSDELADRTLMLIECDENDDLQDEDEDPEITSFSKALSGNESSFLDTLSMQATSQQTTQEQSPHSLLQDDEDEIALRSGSQSPVDFPESMLITAESQSEMNDQFKNVTATDIEISDYQINSRLDKKRGKQTANAYSKANKRAKLMNNTNSGSSSSEKISRSDNQPVAQPYMLPIHSIIFCANSEYFKGLLMSSNMRESKENVVKIYLQRGELQTFLKLTKMFYRREEFPEASSSDNASSEATIGREEESKICELISLLHLADKFLCTELITYFHSVFVDIEPTKVSTLNLLVDFLSKIETRSSTLYASHKVWMEPCLRFLQANYFPMESMLALHLHQYIDGCSLDTVEFMLKHATNSVLTENSLVTVCIMALTKKHAKGDVISRLLHSLRFNLLKDASFIANTLTSNHPFLSSWPGYQSWYTQTLELVVLQSNRRSGVVHNPEHDQFLETCRNWPIVKFVCNIETYANEDSNQRVMTAAQPGPHILGNGYLFNLISVLLKKGQGSARHFEVSFEVEIVNIKANPHSELKFSFKCCPRALGGGPSKNEHPWDSDVTVASHDTRFKTIPFTMTSTRPITFSHFKDMYFHILII